MFFQRRSLFPETYDHCSIYNEYEWQKPATTRHTAKYSVFINMFYTETYSIFPVEPFPLSKMYFLTLRWNFSETLWQLFKKVFNSSNSFTTSFTCRSHVMAHRPTVLKFRIHSRKQFTVSTIFSYFLRLFC